MPKKTSRAARVAQNSQKRISSARPMTATASTVEDNQDDYEETETTSLMVDEPEEKVETISERPSMLRQVAAPVIEVERPGATSSTGRSTGRTIPRRFATPQANKQPVVNRQQEYTFIRSDLITVTVLTILMIIILVVLALFLAK
jgi:hypothetical protein